MKKHLLIPAGLLLAVLTAHGAGTQAETAIDAKTAFTRLQSLVGEWEAKTPSGGKMPVTYELIACGTALVERETAENMPAMETVYHLDGGRLMLTHYCMMGNQPRMQARAFNPETGELKFEFVDVTNLASPGAGHMHNATLRLIDNNHLDTNWQLYENGQPKLTEAGQYVRVR